MPRRKDPYVILGIDPDATADEIKRAFHARVKCLHPDRFDRNSQSQEWEEANSMLAEVVEAYNALKSGTTDPRSPSNSTNSSSEQNAESQHDSDKHVESPTISRGSAFFHFLPTHLKEYLLNLQTAGIAKGEGLRLDTVVKTYVWSGVLASGILLCLSRNDTRQDMEELAFMLVASTIAWLLLGLALRKIINWHKSTLNPVFYSLPLYFVKTDSESVSWWPLWDLKDISVTHRYTNGSFTESEIVLVLTGQRTKICAKSKKLAEAFLERMRKHERDLRSAVSAENWDYLLRNDLFRGVVASEGPSLASRNRKSTVLAFGIAGVFGIGIQATALAINAQCPSLYGPPPSAYVSSVAAPAMEQPHSVNDSTPPAVASNNNAKPSSFSEPEVARPENGWVHLAPGSGTPVAPFEIRTPPNSGSYYVKLSRPDGKQIATIFVHGGTTAEVEVPLGAYKMKYCTGGKWYGTKFLFGPDTAYFKATDVFTFTRDREGVSGYTVELIKQVDGNLKTDPIRPEEW